MRSWTVFLGLSSVLISCQTKQTKSPSAPLESAPMADTADPRVKPVREPVATESAEMTEIEKIALGIGDVFRFNYAPRNVGFQKPAVRAAFRRTLGCANAEFQVLPNLASSIKTDSLPKLFSTEGRHAAFVRFSRDRTAPVGEDDWDKATMAVSIKLDVKSKGGKSRMQTVQDFILQNHPVFFAKDAEEFLLAFANPRAFRKEVYEMVKPILDRGPISSTDRERLNRILSDMEKQVGNPLRKIVWSVTPYSFADTYSKYRILPVLCEGQEEPQNVIDPSMAFVQHPGVGQLAFDQIHGDEPLPERRLNNNLEYQKNRLIRDLSQQAACYDFQVQLFVDEDETPVDDATKLWSETASPPITVAKIYIPKQEISAHSERCETLRFTPGNAAKDLRPAGSINAARSFIYDRFSQCRKRQNDGGNGEALGKSCLP